MAERSALLEQALWQRNPGYMKREQAEQFNTDRAEFVQNTIGQKQKGDAPIDFPQVMPFLDPVRLEDPDYQEGTGYLGGKMSREQAISKMAGSKFPNIQRAGLNRLSEMLAPSEQGANPYTNVQVDPTTGQAFGLDKRSGQFVEIPGQRMGPTQLSPQAQRMQQMQQAQQWTPAQQVSATNTMRKSFRQETSGFEEVDKAWNLITTADETGIGDIVSIFAFMKAIDPSSTVREGEAATVANSAGVSEQVRSAYNNALAGRSLSAKARADLKRQVTKMRNHAYDRYSTTKKGYSQQAQDFGLKPSHVTGVTEYRPSTGYHSIQDYLKMDQKTFSSATANLSDAEFKTVIEQVKAMKDQGGVQ